MRVRKIPTVIVSSVIVCGFSGCGTAPAQKTRSDVSRLSRAGADVVLQQENRTLKQALTNLRVQNNLTKWSEKLDVENTALKEQLDRLEKPLNEAVGMSDEEELNSLKARVNNLKRKVEERAKKLKELKRLVRAAN